MTVSYIVGRTGMLDDETGLFVLEGEPTRFSAPSNTLSLLQGERKMAEFNSQVPYKDAVPGPDFLNKRLGWFSNLDLRDRYLDAIGGEENILKIKDSMYTAHNTRKIAPRKFINQFSGIAGDTVRLKAILRQQGVGTKRVVLFYTGVPRDKGGRTWVVSPHGFGASTIDKHIWIDASGVLVKTLEESDCRLDNKFLWLGVTNAIPFISNSPVRCRDETSARFLMTDYSAKKHDEVAATYINRVLDFGGACDLFDMIIQNNKPDPPKKSFKTALSVGVTDELFNMKGVLSG